MLRKRLTWLVLLLVFAFVGDRFGGWILGKIRDNSQFRYSRLYTNRAKADILLVGNSRGLPLFQPYVEEATGKTTLNLSYNGLPNYLGVAFVLDYLDRYPAPDVIVYDVSICNGGNPPLLNGMAPYAEYSPRVDSLIQAVCDLDTMKTYYAAWSGQQVSHVYRYDSEVFLQILYYLTKTDKYWLVDRVIPDQMIKEMDQFPVLPYDIWPSMMDDLNQLVKAADSKGTKVKFILGPYFPGFAKAKVIDKQRLIDTTTLVTGLPVHDFSSSLTDPSFFADYQHPNKKGSKAYIQLLKENGIFD